MPNKNYLKGKQKEFRTCKKLREVYGFDIAQRTAGSRSPFDVIGIHKEKKIIRLIQCKPASMNDTKKQKIREENKELNGEFSVRFSVI